MGALEDGEMGRVRRKTEHESGKIYEGCCEMGRKGWGGHHDEPQNREKGLVPAEG